jgi:hypothetical protein
MHLLRFDKFLRRAKLNFDRYMKGKILILMNVSSAVGAISETFYYNE